MREGEAMTQCKCGCNQPVTWPQKYYATAECRILENARRTKYAYEPVKGPGWEYKRRSPEEIAANPRRHNRRMYDPQQGRKKEIAVKEPFEMVKKCLKCSRPFPSTGKGNRLCSNCGLSNGKVCL